MASAMAVGESGSTSSAAPAAVSRQRGGVRADHRAADGHRLDHGQAEALVEAREDQAARAGQQHRQRRRRRRSRASARASAMPSRSAARAKLLPSCFGRPAIASTAPSSVPRARTVAHASSSRREVLARLHGAEADDVRPGSPNRPGSGGTGANRASTASGSTVIRSRSASRTGRAARRGRAPRSSHVRGALRRPRHEALEREPVGDRHRLAEVRPRAVGDRQHRRARQARRQHVVAVVQRRPVAAQLPRQRDGDARVVRADRQRPPACTRPRGCERRGVAHVREHAERQVDATRARRAGRAPSSPRRRGCRPSTSASNVTVGSGCAMPGIIARRGQRRRHHRLGRPDRLRGGAALRRRSGSTSSASTTTCARTSSARTASTRWNARAARAASSAPATATHDLDIRDRDGDRRAVRASSAATSRWSSTRAAQPSHDWAAREPFTDFDVNAVGTLNLLEATRRHAPDAVVHLHARRTRSTATRPNALPLVELETRWEIDPAHTVRRRASREDMSIDAYAALACSARRRSPPT